MIKILSVINLALTIFYKKLLLHKKQRLERDIAANRLSYIKSEIEHADALIAELRGER